MRTLKIGALTVAAFAAIAALIIYTFPGKTPLVKIYTDPATGCQYVVYASGGISPRLRDNGTQLCGDSDEQ